jgi:excisionase family DNA binding protein
MRKTEKLERRTYTVSETCAVLGVSRNMGYEVVRTGCIRAIKIGKRVVIPRSEMERLLAGQPAQTASGELSRDRS